MESKTFKINFKLYYHELCDWASEYIEAPNKRVALRKFAKAHHINRADITTPERWRWWEDDWYNAFHLIEKVVQKHDISTTCNGSDIIAD